MRVFFLLSLWLLTYGTHAHASENWKDVKKEENEEFERGYKASERCFYETGQSKLKIEYQECVAKASGPRTYERFLKRQWHYDEAIEEGNKLFTKDKTEKKQHEERKANKLLDIITGT